MQDSNYHMTPKSHFISEICTKCRDFGFRKRDAFMDANVYCYDVICIFNRLVDYRFLLHDFITLSDATSYDKYMVKHHNNNHSWHFSQASKLENF